MTRALVLGGGGLTGIAWEAGVLVGLAEAGHDVRRWDLVIGTSAGSVVGAKVLGEPDFAAWFERQLVEAVPEDDLPIQLLGGRLAAAFLRAGRRRGLSWAPKIWLTAFALETLVRLRAGRGGRGAPPGPDDPTTPLREVSPADPGLARIGAFGLAARTASEATFREVMTEILAPVDAWPRGLTVTAIDARSGATVAIDAESGVPFIDAVSASCAVPTFMPTVTIGGRRYMDGGMASQTHADLAAGHDEVLVVAPLDLGPLDPEVERLRAGGSRVTVITPGPEAARAIGRNIALLDPARRARAAHTGRADGRRAGRGLSEDGAPQAGRTRLARSEG